MGAETAAPVARTAGPRRARGRADPGGASPPASGNRARQALLAPLGPIMRCACGCGGACEEPAVARSALAGAGGVMRCACGCGGACEADSVSRSAAPGAGAAAPAPAAAGVTGVVGRPGRPLDRRTRRRMERGFGRDFGGVRIHTDAAAATSARRLAARAYSVGDHLVFGSGQYAPGSRDGQRLIAHELAHTVQQRDGRHVQRAGTVSSPGDPHEREADRVAAAVVDGRSATPVLTAPAGVNRSWLGDAWDAATDAVGEGADAVVDFGGEVVEDVEDVAGAAVDFATGGIKAVWDLAHDIADAIGGAIDVSGCGITITVPGLSIDRALTFELPLPSLSETLPIAVGVWPIAGVVNAYGMVYLNVTAAPTLAVQLGPASLNSGSLFIDWCDPSFGGALDFTYALGGSLGAELRGGVGGEVGLEVNVPVGPAIVPIPIPLASVDVGLVGALLGTGITTVHEVLRVGYSGGSLGVHEHMHMDAGLKLSAGAGLFGSLSALGFALCTIHWPLWRNAWETTFSIDRGLDLGLSAGGVSLDFGASLDTSPGFAFDDLPVALNTDVLTDDCPILSAVCRVLYGLGRMPSQNGGTWAGHEPAPIPGPLAGVYERSPASTTAKCRGACGPDCRTCDHLGTVKTCVDDGGRHHWVAYPEFEDCPTHGACREHDGCYDWCSEGASGLEALLCRRMCDLECVCNHAPSDCIGWIFGIGGDGTMEYAETPFEQPGCDGPCPAAPGQEVTAAMTLRECLDPVILTEPLVLEDAFEDGTDNIPLFETIVDLGPAGFAALEVYARGEFAVSGRAAIDSIRLDGLCLEIDPAGPTYRGTAELHVPVALDGEIALTGTVGGALDWLCLIRALKLEGGLTGTGTVATQIELVNTAVVVNCADGHLDLDNSAELLAALQLGFDLAAFLRVFVFGFKVFSDTWPLASATWNREWEWDLEVLNRRGAGAGLILPALTVGAIGVVELLRFLFDREPQEEDTPPSGGILSQLSRLCPTFSHDTPQVPSAAPGTCGSPSLPLTNVVFTGSSDRGEHVVAQPLTRCPGNTQGSPPDQSIFSNVWSQCITPAGQQNLWVRAHLLHGETSGSSQDLHGPGDTPRNLILTDKSLNGRISTQVERPAIAAVRANRVLWYEVDVDHFADTGDRRFFGEEFHMAWGDFDPIAGTRGPAIFDSPVESRIKRQPPPCPSFTP